MRLLFYYIIRPGVPLGSVLGPTLYKISTADIPQTESVEIATFADVTAITTVHYEPNRTIKLLQKGLNEIGHWAQIWNIKMNASKSTHMNFTTWNIAETQIVINSEMILTTNDVSYLGMHLDRRMTLKAHVTANIKRMDPKL